MVLNILNKLNLATVNVFFVAKKKKNAYEAFRLPDKLDENAKNKYLENLRESVKDKKPGKYGFMLDSKTEIPKIETKSIEIWKSICESISKAKFLDKKNFSDDYQMIVLDYAYEEKGNVFHLYLAAKHIKVSNWYKKGFMYSITANKLVEGKTDIIVLNNSIDAIICNSDTYILNKGNFETIFNYYEAAKKRWKAANRKFRSGNFYRIAIFFTIRLFLAKPES
jgi:hypothetical protein